MEPRIQYAKTKDGVSIAFTTASYTNKPYKKKSFLGTGTPGIILDHIYVTDDISALAVATDPATIDGEFPSDHMPVLADLIIREDRSAPRTIPSTL